MTCLRIVSFVLLTAALASCQRSPGQAAPSAANAPPTSVAPHAPSASASAAEAATVIPDGVEGVWQAIDRDNAELKATVESGSLENVHHLAFAIRDLVAALPAKMPALDAAAKAKLEGEVGFVETLANRLDQSGDAKDRAATQASYQQLATVLAGMSRPHAKP